MALDKLVLICTVQVKLNFSMDFDWDKEKVAV